MRSSEMIDGQILAGFLTMMKRMTIWSIIAIIKFEIVFTTFFIYWSQFRCFTVA